MEEQAQKHSTEIAELTIEINELIQADVLDLSDIKKLKEKVSALLNDSMANSENIGLQKVRYMTFCY